MNESTPTVGELLREAENLLAVTSSSARLDSEVLVAHALGVSRTSVLISLRDPCSVEVSNAFHAYVARRAAGEPVAYITGEREFWGLSFLVSPDVLVPRPETELLVEEALRILRASPSPRVLDMGTGSGCIGISIAHELAKCGVRDHRCTLLDKSPQALSMAKQNALRHGVEHYVDFVESSWFENSAALRSPYDLIVSNPPYVSRDEIVPRELSYEPQGALYSDDDGLRDTKILLEAAKPFLKPHGTVLIEVGAGKREHLKRYVREGACPARIEYVGDDTPADRFTVLRCVYAS
jgi:release factor glutamine methyltransferase